MIYNFFNRAQETNIYEIKSQRLRSQKVVGTEKVDIGNLEDLLRVVFIDEESGNLKVVIVMTSVTVMIIFRKCHSEIYLIAAMS